MNWQDDHNRRVRAMPDVVREAHRHSIWHRQEILESTVCGCFCCCATFGPDAIREWVDDADDGIGQTAVCPKCGIDAVIGDKSGVVISQPFLEEMKAHWFSSQ